MLNIEVDKLKSDIKNNYTGGITIEELINVYEGTKVELQVWNYIAKTIETNNN